jgi:very-short-patch-repair endonuclease
VVSEANRERFFLPHSNIDPRTRTRAKKLRTDGDSHETLSGRTHDIRRDNFLKSQGFTVLRFDNAQVIDGPDFVFLTIEQAIAGSLKKEPSQ